MKILDTEETVLLNLLTLNILLTVHKVFLNHKQALFSISELNINCYRLKYVSVVNLVLRKIYSFVLFSL